ncbi:MAG: DUF2461 domain-containing protein [Candidatus Nanopelagicales bacterium]
MPTHFAGIPAAAFQFYADLEVANSRDFWAAHRSIYDESVRDPLHLLMSELEPEFGPGRLFRPYRDVRFSADKSPYKEHQGGYVEVGPACGYYVQVSSGGMMVAAGWHAPASAQVSRYREAVVSPAGQALVGLLGGLRRRGLEVGGERLKTQPRGVPADHPMVELLRYRSLTVSTDFALAEPWLGTAEAAQRVGSVWRAAKPLVEWLADNVTGRGEQR